jgi:hypothetical protein
VEDTSARHIDPCDCGDDESDRTCSFEPRMILEIADCTDRINLEFDEYDRRERQLQEQHS